MTSATIKVLPSHLLRVSFDTGCRLQNHFSVFSYSLSFAWTESYHILEILSRQQKQSDTDSVFIIWPPAHRWKEPHSSYDILPVFLALTNNIMGLRISSFIPSISIISFEGCASSTCSSANPARITPIRICVNV